MSTYQSLLDYCNERKVDLVAVSKTKPNEAIINLYDQGQRIFGENRVQELVEKEEALPKEIHWHMIGHLQTNKVKLISPFVSMIHSGDRISLLKEINKQAKKIDKIIDVLLQVKIASEESKHGWSEQEISKVLNQGLLSEYTNINIRGVMGMASFTDNEEQITAEFQKLKSFFDFAKKDIYPTKDDFDTISMGMSGDYKIAIEAGSNMIRVGSLLFGARK